VKQLGFFIAASLLFHFLISTTTLYFAEKYQTSSKPELTEIEILDSNDDSLQAKMNETRQLIKQLKTTVQKIQDNKIKARFESEQTQRVAQETRANNLGLSQNAVPTLSAQRPNNTQLLPQKNINVAQNEKPQEPSDTPEFARHLRTSNSQVSLNQMSAISANLPSDIQNSNATNLNTDSNTYYSFYNRVEELFYVRWVERARYYWDRTGLDYKKNVLAGKTWSTTLEVWLLANGEFHSAYIKQASGYKPFDDAAVFAFSDARLFPNPPKAKVESDGFVRLRYRFNINVAAY
jgi:TonB family protein